MNENIKEIAKIVIKELDKNTDGTFYTEEIATALHKAGYRPEAEVRAETAKEIVKNILAFSYYIKFEDTNGKDREELVVYESKIKQLAEQYGKENQRNDM